MIDLPSFTATHRETCNGGCPTCQLLDEIDLITSERDKTRSAARDFAFSYGRHQGRCAINRPQAYPCNCGHNDAIDKIDGDRKAASDG